MCSSFIPCRVNVLNQVGRRPPFFNTVAQAAVAMKESIVDPENIGVTLLPAFQCVAVLLECYWSATVVGIGVTLLPAFQCVAARTKPDYE